MPFFPPEIIAALFSPHVQARSSALEGIVAELREHPGAPPRAVRPCVVVVLSWRLVADSDTWIGCLSRGTFPPRVVLGCPYRASCLETPHHAPLSSSVRWRVVEPGFLHVSGTVSAENLYVAQEGTAQYTRKISSTDFKLDQVRASGGLQDAARHRSKGTPRSLSLDWRSARACLVLLEGLACVFKLSTRALVCWLLFRRRDHRQIIPGSLRRYAPRIQRQNSKGTPVKATRQSRSIHPDFESPGRGLIEFLNRDAKQLAGSRQESCFKHLC